MLWHRQVLPDEPQGAPGPRDIQVARSFERAGGATSRAAACLLLSQYCSSDPALVATDAIRQLRLKLFGGLDALAWQEATAASLTQPAARELAERMERRRLMRHLTHAKFTALLSAHLPTRGAGRRSADY